MDAADEVGERARGPRPTARDAFSTRVACYVAVLAPIVVACVDEFRNDRGLDASRGDLALIELATDAAVHGDRWLGPYSQYGFSHPGPLVFYLFAPFYRLASGHAMGLHVAAALFAALVLTGFVASIDRPRSSTKAAHATAIATSVVLVGAAGFAGDHALGSPLSSPWNPAIAAIATFGTAWLSARVAVGDGFLLPQLVVAHALAAQSHSSASVVATPMLLVALAHSIRRGSVPVRVRNVAVLVALLAWAPPFVEASRHHGGNLRALFEFVVDSPLHAKGRVGASSTLRAIAWTLHAVVPVSAASVFRSGWIDAAFAVALVVASIAARRNGDERTRLGIDVGLVGLAASASMVPMLRGLPALHLAFPAGAASLFLQGTIVRSLAYRRGGSAPREVWAFAALALASTLASSAQVDARRAADRRFPNEDAIAIRVAATTRCVARRSEVAITLAKPTAWVFATAAARVAYAEGRSPMLDPSARARFGSEIEFGAASDHPERTNLVFGAEPVEGDPWSRDHAGFAIALVAPTRGPSIGLDDELRRCLDAGRTTSPILGR